MSANVNANVVSSGEVEGKICGLDQPEAAAAATSVNAVVDCNGNGKDYVDHDPVIDQNSVADQVRRLEEDDKHTEVESGLNDDEIKKEQNFQQKEREEKVVEVVASGVHEAEVASFSNAEDHESQDTRVDVAKAEPNKSSNDEKMVGEDSKLDSAIDIEENKDSQDVLINGSHCVVVNGVHDNLDLVKEKEPSELINSEDVIESKPNQSPNHGLDKVKKESKVDSTVDTEENKDSQSVVINSVHNDFDLNQENGQKVLINDEDVAESKPHQSSNNEDKIDEERKLDLAVDIEENKDSQSVVTNGVHNDLDLDKKGQTELINDVPVEDSQKASVVSHETPEAESAEGHTQDSVAKTEVADDCVANQNDFVHASQTTTEQNQPSEIATKMPSPVVHEDAPVESGENFPVAPISHDVVVESADTVEDSCSMEDTKLCDTVQTEPEVDNVSANDSENIDSHSVDGAKEETEAKKAPVVDHTTLSCPGSNVNPDIQTSSQNIESEERVSAFSSSDVEVKSDVIEGVAGDAGTNSVSVDNPDGETSTHDSIEKKNCVPMLDVKAESEVENISTAPSEEMPDRNGFASQNEVLNDSVDTIENGADQNINRAADKKSCQEEEAIGVRGDEAPTSTPEDEQNATAEVAKGPFYMIRVPRYDDNDIKEKIKHAQFKVDEKTKFRDAIRDQIQKKRASCREYDAVEAAKSEEKAARSSLKEKRKEIDSVQSKINRVRSAIDVEEIDSRIRNMEHMMQHETLPLKEEKQFIREIKQLKQIREQLSANMSSEDQVQQDMNQKDQVEDHLKALQSLRKEADVLRDNVVKTEAATKSAKQKYSDVNDQLNELLDQFRAADDIRQEAYAHLQSLRKQLHEKNKYFWKYKDDSTAAANLALKGGKQELQRHCVNQVERVMELWNNNDEFRKEYVRCNMRSTLRRLRTFDGRALGPDEQPPTIPNVVSQRLATDNIAPSAPALEAEKPVAPVETENVDAKSTPKIGEQKNQTAKAKKHPKPAALENGLPTVSGKDQIEQSREEEHKQTKEEEELARKAEELRKEKEAAVLKEHRKLEEKAKAKEAMERKKRIADKAQARAALKAQKEAEEKEKEREKRARKKEKKNAAAEDAKDINEAESAPSSETLSETKESESKEKPLTVTKRAQKPSQFAKQTKAKSMPLPLRNRGKRRMQTWMWVLIVLLVVIALFLLGNSSFSFNFGLLRFGF